MFFQLVYRKQGSRYNTLGISRYVSASRLYKHYHSNVTGTNIKDRHLTARHYNKIHIWRPRNWSPKVQISSPKESATNIQLVAKGLSLKVLATKSKIVAVCRHLATRKFVAKNHIFCRYKITICC